MKPIEINLKQGSPEWLQFRKDKIGASDAPVIMQVNPWRKPLDLFEEKIGIKEVVVNDAMERGKYLEPIALQAIQKKTGLTLTPKVFQHPTLHWMIASLDGIDNDGIIVREIKCPKNQADIELARCGIVPPKYIPQLQHQMAVMSLDSIYYDTWTDYQDDYISILVHRDDEYIKKLIAKEFQFWDNLQNLIAPDDGYQELNDPFFEAAVSQLIGIQDYLKQLKHFLDKEKMFKENIIALCNGKNSKGFDITVQKIFRKGCIDYSAIPELKGVDLEKYRKPPTEYWKVSV